MALVKFGEYISDKNWQNFTTSNPTVNDDITAGYIVGSEWTNTTTKAKYVCVDNSTGAAIWAIAGNDGKVKINGSGGVDPSYSLTAGVDQIVDYGVAALDLSSSPTNEFPQNIASPSDSDIWDSANTSLIENTVLGQQHIWRVILDYSGKNLNDVVGLDVFLSNPLSGFEAHALITLPEGVTSGSDMQAIIMTIADGASLPSPFGTGQGYELTLNSTSNITVTITSVTRISLQHFNRD